MEKTLILWKWNHTIWNTSIDKNCLLNHYGQVNYIKAIQYMFQR
jgi:hypothetical protein